MQNAPHVDYEVEDDLEINFFEALKCMQSVQSVEPLVEENACLITNVPLNLFHVTLECGHKFNYEPLYQEVLRQKGRMGSYNYHEKIGIHQIKCPYCRTLTNHLMPYIGNHPVIKRLAGVNSPVSMCMPGVKCSRDKCSVNAFYEHENKPYCMRHHKSASKLKPTPTPKKNATGTRCCAEIQTGKNKGTRCTMNAIESNSEPHLCKKHSKCNMVLYGHESQVAK